MIKTLTAVGNSLGLIIDKPILELLNIDKDTPLEVRTDGEGLIIRPVKSAAEAAMPPGTQAPLGPADALAALDEEASAAEDDADDADDADDLDAAPAPEPAPESAPPPAPEPPQAAPPPPEPPAPPAPPPDLSKPAAAPQSPAPSPGGAEPEVVIELRGEELCRVPLTDAAVVIGRDPSADVHLDDRALSRKHARVERRGAAIWVVDLGSANGTFINGERVDEAYRLHADDVVGVGHYRVRIDGVEEAKADTPVLTLYGPEGTHRFALVGEEIVVGRSANCDISISHKSISRRHVRILTQNGAFFVEDLGSANPAVLNGETLSSKPVPFRVGDLLEICDFRLELGVLSDEYNDASEGGEKKRSSTMLIDKSVVVQAAYVEGDFAQVRPGAPEPDAKKSPNAGGYNIEGDEAKRRSERVIRPKRKAR